MPAPNRHEAERPRGVHAAVPHRDPALPSPSDPLFVIELASEAYGTFEFAYHSLDEALAAARDLFGRASREWEDDRVVRRISLVIGHQDE